MGTLTIRTTEEQEAKIESLKNLFGEASASKAIMTAVERYEKLDDVVGKTRTDLNVLRAQMNELISALNKKEEAENVLEKYKNWR